MARGRKKKNEEQEEAAEQQAATVENEGGSDACDEVETGIDDDANEGDAETDTNDATTEETGPVVEGRKHEDAVIDAIHGSHSLTVDLRERFAKLALDAEDKGMLDALVHASKGNDLLTYHLRQIEALDQRIEGIKANAKRAKEERDYHMEKAKSIALGVPIDQDLFEMQAAATRYHSEKAALMVTSRVAYDYLFGTVDEYENAAKLMQLRDADIAMKFYGDHSALGGDIVPIPRTRIDNLGARLQGLKDADVARRKRTGQRSLPTSHDLRDVPAGANVEPIHDDHAPQAAVL